MRRAEGQDAAVPLGVQRRREVAALWWVLRIGTWLCFVGHGAFGLRMKAGWLPLFAGVGIAGRTAYHLMPLIGATDIVVGTLLLVQPRAALTAYAVGWTIWTAALRPIAGLPVWEFVERAGNFGVPLVLLFLSAPARALDGTSRIGAWREWCSPSRARPLTPPLVPLLRWALAGTTALLLVGHAALNLLGKPELVSHAALIASGHGAELAWGSGLVELALAGLVLWRPTLALALGITGWKLATEALFLAAGAPVWEIVERGGSYAAPLALALLLWSVRDRRTRLRSVHAANSVDFLAAPR